MNKIWVVIEITIKRSPGLFLGLLLPVCGALIFLCVIAPLDNASLANIKRQKERAPEVQAELESLLQTGEVLFEFQATTVDCSGHLCISINVKNKWKYTTFVEDILYKGKSFGPTNWPIQNKEDALMGWYDDLDIGKGQDISPDVCLSLEFALTKFPDYNYTYPHTVCGTQK